MMLLAMMLGADVVTHGTSGEVSTITTGAISAVVGAICTVLVMYFRSRSKVTVDGEVNVRDDARRQHRQEVSWTEIRDLKDRVHEVERRIDEIKTAQGKNFVLIMESQHAGELRVLEKLDQGIKSVHERMDALLKAIALEKPKR